MDLKVNLQLSDKIVREKHWLTNFHLKHYTEQDYLARQETKEKMEHTFELLQ